MTWFLVVLAFGGAGPPQEKTYQYANEAACKAALSTMRLTGESQVGAATVVALCAPGKV